MSTNRTPSLEIQLGQLARIVDGELDGASDPGLVVVLGPRRVAVHSTRVESGTVFVALQGKRDGHEWVDAALRQGAVCAIVRNDWLSTNAPGTLVRVQEPLAALQKLAAWYRQQLTCDVVAVAGTVGKTTTKEALVSFLNESEFCYGSPGSYNSQMGVALSILECPASADRAVIEVAATAPGEMTRIADILRPTTVVIAAIGDRFVSAFGSLDNYVYDLLELCRYQPAGSFVVCGSKSTDIRHFVHDSLRFHSPFTESWPVVSEERLGGGRTLVTLKTSDALVRQIEVLSSSTWLADDVAIAAATAALFGKPPCTQKYAPISLDLQSWRSPSGAYVLRSAAVDEPMAWRIAIGDAFAASTGNGHVYFVLSDSANSLSRETLSTIAEAHSHNRATVLVTEGNAANVLREFSMNVAVRVLESVAEIGRIVTKDMLPGDVVAVFAARNQLIEGVSKELRNAMAPARLRVDIDAIEQNLALIRRQCPGAKVMSVVKAGAYGANAPEIARHLGTLGIDEFAVSDTDEGAELRRSGISLPILVLHPTPEEFEKAFHAHLTLCIHSEELLDAAVANQSRVVAVQIECETGMNRTGLPPEIVVSALQRLQAAGIRVTGIFSHLAAADDPALDSFTNQQFATFTRILDSVSASGLPMPTRHILASSGIIRFPEFAYDMVRAGVAMLGIAPSKHCNAIPLVPALTLLSKVIERRTLKPGDRVGYGGSYRAESTIDVGVVQLGYADGIHRSFGATGWVIIDGARCKVIGVISMDSLVVDLTPCPTAQVGSDVLFFGTQGRESQSLETVAEAMGTIPYEVIGGLGSRIQRIFVRH